MSQINAAYDDSRLQQISPPESQPAEIIRRSPEQQAEFERLGKADTYLVLDSDEELFEWLDDQRDLGECGYVTAPEGAGLHKVCRYYQMERVKQRRGKFLLPVSVVYTEIEQYGGPTDLYGAVLAACNHPLAYVGPLKDRRNRTRNIFKDYSVKQLIVNNAEYLTLESFNELVDLAKKLNLSIVLLGTPYLTEILDRNSLPYLRVYNSFLESYEFPRLGREAVKAIVDDWEELFLPEGQRLNLTSIPEIPDFLLHKANGLREPLYDIVRQIATLRVDQPNFHLNKQNLVKCLGRRKQPKAELGKKAAR